MIKLGVYWPHGMPESFRVCKENIVKRLSPEEYQIHEFSTEDQLQPADLVWDPTCGGGNPTREFIVKADIPKVITLHGIGPIVYPRMYCNSIKELYWQFLKNRRNVARWRKDISVIDRVITVSMFSKRLLNQKLSIPDEKIQVIYNGVDTDNFVLKSEDNPEPYFLHISNDEKRKNVDRIIRAYTKLGVHDKWPLVIKISSGRECKDPNIEIINGRLSDSDVARLVQKSGCLLLPSVYEGFGIPIIEAFATGTDVITSKNTACEEIAGGNAILVNPASDSSIMRGMATAMHKYGQRSDKVRYSLAERARYFSWQRCASEYSDVFRSLLGR